MKHNILKVLLSLTVIGVSSLRAEDLSPVANQMTPDALVREALAKNPELNFYAAEIAAAKGERRTADTRANPEFSAQLGVKSVQADSKSNEGVASAFSLQQPFEWPGRVELRKAIANRQIELAELGLSQFRASLAARVRIVGYKVFTAEHKAVPAREVGERFVALTEILRQRGTAGFAATLEARLIEGTAGALQREASNAEIEVQSALAELNQLRGGGWKTAPHIAAEGIVFPALPRQEVLFVAAAQNNFDLRKRQLELAQLGFKFRLARNERFPAVFVGPYFSYEQAGDREIIGGAGVTVPLPFWNRNQGNIETARAREQQAATSLVVTQREVERKIVEQTARYEAKLKQISSGRPDQLEEYRETAAAADRHYRLGAVPISTYVELQKQYVEAVAALLDIKQQAVEAREELRLLTGLDPTSASLPMKQP